MEVIAFFVLFAVVHHVASGNSKKSDQSAVKDQSAENSAASIFSDLGHRAVVKFHTIGTTGRSEELPQVPLELTETRNWDAYEAPAYRRL